MPVPKTSTKSTKQNLDDFTLIDSFEFGYRHREDKTNLPPGVLVVGSQNILSNTSGRIGITRGYTLDGQSSAVIAPILAAYDYEMHTGSVRHLRAGFLTSAGNDGKLQYRYVDSSGIVTWRDLMTNLTSVNFNFADWWDSTSFQSKLLFVDGSSNIYEWSGGITTYASSTVNTITKEGVETWAEIGFSFPTGSVTIGGVNYAYTGGADTTTLTGVTPDPSGSGYVAGDIIHQTVVTTPNASMTGIPATFANALIANLRNQIYVGSLTNNQVYVSKVNNYKDYTFTAPVRIVGEGAILTLDATSKAFIPQEDSMYISAGMSQWYETKFTLSSDLAKEDLSVNRLKTTAQQATQSQALTSKIKNDVVFVSNEPILNTLGRVDNVVLTPQTTDISFPIVDDFNIYNFTDGSVIYHQKFIYVAIPQSSVVRVYNMTNTVDNTGTISSSTNFYWEAPLTIPISRFSIIDGALYGHSYLVSESYKLFDGLNFNGVPIDARAVFSYNNYGIRSRYKGFNEYYSEGYISPETTLELNITYEIDGCATETSYDIDGDDEQIVCLLSNDVDNSLGKLSLGKAPLGGNLGTGTFSLPKFRVIKTFPTNDFYEVQVTYSSNGTNAAWEILAHGPLLLPTHPTNAPIKQ